MISVKNKKILIIFLVTLLVAVFSITAIALLLVNTKRNDDKNNLKVSAAIDLNECVKFENGEYTGLKDDAIDIYNANTDFIITDIYGLAMVSVFTQVFGFSGKTVTLTTNLDLGGADFCIEGTFAGVFDGGGYVISNISLTEDSSKKEHEYNSQYGDASNGSLLTYHYPVYSLAFFRHVTGTLKNLGINNIKFNFNINGSFMWSKVNIIMSGLVGFGDGAKCNIENCKVENATLESATVTGMGEANPLLNGLIGWGDANIKNCYTNNIVSKLSYGYPSSFGPTWGLNAGLSTPTAFESINISIKSSVAENSSYVTGATDGRSIEIFTDSSSAINGLTEISHTGGLTGTVWYHASEYNDGWPLLRVFMKNWKEVSITSNPLSGAQTGYASKKIQIPSDANNTYDGEILNNGNEAKIVIYDQEVVLKAKDRYRFASWKCNSATNYVANLEAIKYTIIFKDAKIETPYAEIKITPIGNTTIEIGYGELLETDISNNQYIYKYETEKIGMAAIYDLGEANEYTIVSWNLPNGENSWVVGEDYEGTDYIIEITPTFKLKDYGWIFM